MILILVGTQKQNFSRIFKLVENSKKLKNEEIIAQYGFTNYKATKIQMINFMEHDELINKIKQANLIICHGGVGTIFDCLYKNKKILVIPRLKKFKEHINDHQIEIATILQKEGYIEICNDGENFDEKLCKVLKNKYKKYVNDEKYLQILKESI